MAVAQPPPFYPAASDNPAVSIVWRAIIASASVGVMKTGIPDWGAEISESLRAFAIASSVNPNEPTRR